MANRYVKDKRQPNVKPVEKIELDESHLKRRIVLAVLLFAIGLAALSYGIVRLRTAEPEWTEITVDGSSDANLGGAFTFRYHLGQSGRGATAEKKLLTKLYSTQMVELYRLYTASRFVDEVTNVYDIIRRPNETVEVDPRLYHALKLTAEKGGRLLYYGPYYEYYNTAFLSEEDYYAEAFDPARDAEAGAYFEELSAFIRDPESIRMEFPAENQVILRVSDAYLKYAEENGIEVLIDLSPVQNAFAADEMAKLLRENGLVNGFLSSDDGFIANLDESTEMNLTEYALQDGRAVVRDSFSYIGARNLVTLRNFPLKESDRTRFYIYEDGTIISSYIDENGLQAAAFDTLSAFSAEKGCAEILLRLWPYFTGGNLEEKPSFSEMSEELLKDGITVLTKLSEEEAKTDSMKRNHPFSGKLCRR